MELVRLRRAPAAELPAADVVDPRLPLIGSGSPSDPRLATHGLYHTAVDLGWARSLAVDPSRARPLGADRGSGVPRRWIMGSGVPSGGSRRGAIISSDDDGDGTQIQLAVVVARGWALRARQLVFLFVFFSD